MFKFIKFCVHISWGRPLKANGFKDSLAKQTLGPLQVVLPLRHEARSTNVFKLVPDLNACYRLVLRLHTEIPEQPCLLWIWPLKEQWWVVLSSGSIVRESMGVGVFAVHPTGEPGPHPGQACSYIWPLSVPAGCCGLPWLAGALCSRLCSSVVGVGKRRYWVWAPRKSSDVKAMLSPVLL